jgi:hypothetical protein
MPDLRNDAGMIVPTGSTISNRETRLRSSRPFGRHRAAGLRPARWCVLDWVKEFPSAAGQTAHHRRCEIVGADALRAEKSALSVLIETCGRQVPYSGPHFPT